MTKPLRLYGWELDNPTPEDISPVYTDTATLSKGLPLYDNTGEVIPQSWVGNIDTTNNTFNLMEKTPYIASSDYSYLYEIDLGTEKHYYIKEDNLYREVTDQVRINTTISFVVAPCIERYMDALLSSTVSVEYYWWMEWGGYQNIYTNPTEFMTSSFIGYPFMQGNFYFKSCPSTYGVTEYSTYRIVTSGVDTSSYTEDYLIRYPYYDGSGRTEYAMVNPVNLVKLHYKTLKYNNKYYKINNPFQTSYKYAVFTGDQTGNVYYTESNLPNFYAGIYSTSTADSSANTYDITSLYDQEYDCMYAFYNSIKNTYRGSYVWERCTRAPNLDTNTAPWEVTE